MCLCLTPALPAILLAQRATSLDVGFVSVAYDSGTARVNGATLAPAVRLRRSLATLDAGGTLSVFDAGGWSAQGSLAGSAFTPVFHDRLRGEVAGIAGGSGFDDGTRTGQLLGQLRLHVLGARQGAWLAVGGGAGWDDIAWRSVTLAGAGAWLRRGHATLAASVTPTSVSGLRYTDATAALTWAGPTIELTGSLTARHGAGAVAGGTWGDANATLWLSRRVALVAGWGSYAPDPGQALPGGRYVTMSLHLAARPVRYPELHVVRPPRPKAPPGAPRVVEVRDGHDGRHVIRVRVANARRVELMGDFTDWRPVPLVRASRDQWEIALPLAPGTHHFNVRVDGGGWTVPAASPSMEDDFNGRVGVLVVR